MAELIDKWFTRGVQEIYTSEKEVTKENLGTIMQNVMNVHSSNRRIMEKLFEYERGVQSILFREKEIRPEINNKVVTNIAHMVTEFQVGYGWGQPFSYVQRAQNDEHDATADDGVVNTLNRMFAEEEKESKDVELARNFSICGVGYRMIMPKDEEGSVSSFDIVILNPLNTFIVKSADVYHIPMLAGVYWTDENKHVHYTCYSKDKVFEFDGIYQDSFTFGENYTESVNGIGEIPIVEYINDYSRMGCFQRVIPLIDAYNIAQSDRVNGVEQFIQSLLWLNNVDLDEEGKSNIREYGLIMTRSGQGVDAHIEDIKRELDQSGSQNLVDDMYNKILEITGTPARGNTGGGNTGVALMLGESGWQMAEEKAQALEKLFVRGEKACLKVIKAIVEKDMDSGIDELRVNDIAIKTNRNKISNLAVKTNSLATMINAGIHPLHAIINSDLFSDPQQVYLDSIPYLANGQTTVLDVENTDNQLRVDEYGQNLGVQSVFKKGVEKIQPVNRGGESMFEY